MKKKDKQNLLLELSTAIESVLNNYDDKAATKSKKVIRKAGKVISKKFRKSMKADPSKKKTLKKGIKTAARTSAVSASRKISYNNPQHSSVGMVQPAERVKPDYTSESGGAEKL